MSNDDIRTMRSSKGGFIDGTEVLPLMERRTTRCTNRNDLLSLYRYSEQGRCRIYDAKLHPPSADDLMEACMLPSGHCGMNCFNLHSHLPTLAWSSLVQQ